MDSKANDIFTLQKLTFKMKIKTNHDLRFITLYFKGIVCLSSVKKTRSLDYKLFYLIPLYYLPRVREVVLRCRCVCGVSYVVGIVSYIIFFMGLLKFFSVTFLSVHLRQTCWHVYYYETRTHSCVWWCHFEWES